MLKSQLEEVPKVFKNLRVIYIDCDEAEDLVDELDVDTVQTLVVIHPQESKKPIERHLGLTADKLNDLLQTNDSFY